jgi:hypothetical protein
MVYIRRILGVIGQAQGEIPGAVHSPFGRNNCCSGQIGGAFAAGKPPLATAYSTSLKSALFSDHLLIRDTDPRVPRRQLAMHGSF